MFQESRPTPVLHNPASDIYSTGLSNTPQKAARSLETPTFDISAQFLSKSAPTVGQSPEFRQMSERMHNFQMQPQQQQQQQQHPVQSPAPNMLPSPTQPSMLSGMWFKSQPSPPIILPPPQQSPSQQQQQQQQQQQHQQQRSDGFINNQVQQPFGLVMDHSSPMHSNFIKAASTLPPPPQHAGYISQQFVPHPQHPPPPPLSSNFGAIGQNIRPAVLPPQPQQPMPPPNSLLQQFGGSVNMAHRSWSGPPPGIPDPRMESRVSIFIIRPEIRLATVAESHLLSSDKYLLGIEISQISLLLFFEFRTLFIRV